MNFKNTMMAVIGAAAMIVPMTSTTGFCAESAQPTTKDTTLKYQVNEGYEWTIHTEINFGKNKGINQVVDGAVTDDSAQKVTVTKNVISEGKKLHITAAGSGTDGAFQITNGGTEKLAYDVASGGNAVGVNGDVLDVASGTNTSDTDMTFKLHTTDKAAEVAGDYQGTITYSASVVDAK